MTLAQKISNTQVAEGQVAIFYLAQAGFAFKTPGGTVLFMDPYLSDCCERMFEFKRMIPPVIKAGEVQCDIFASTHSHADHLDADGMAIIAKNTDTVFLGAADCRETYETLGIDDGRVTIIDEGQECVIKDITFRGIYADHGDLAPDAIGMLMTIGDINIYNAADTSYQPEEILKSLGEPVDVMIAPINGAFGNLDHNEACKLAADVKPKVVIASHFGMFIQHGGSPSAFLAEAENLPAGITPVVLAPGETLIYDAEDGIISTETMKVDL